MNVSICYEPPLKEHDADLQDILKQAAFIRRCLTTAGYSVKDIVYEGDPVSFFQKVKEARPSVLWNLFETFNGAEEKLNIGAALLELTGVPYIGSRLDTITICTDKRTVKGLLNLAGIKTPEMYPSFRSGKWILKPSKLHGSVGITERSVIDADSEERLLSEFLKYPKEYEMFAERYVDGREFSASLLDTGNGLETIAVSEMLFTDYQRETPKILTFNAKWAEESFEYKNSVRSFDFNKSDIPLIEEMGRIAGKAAFLLKVSGFARIDFRLDTDNQIWVIDVNLNPCMGEDAGFVAACEYAGITREEAVSYIIKAALSNCAKKPLLTP